MITPMDIQQHQFKTRPFGYEKSSVDHFLELIAEELELQLRQNQELKENLVRTRAALEEMREREMTLKDTLITTQRVTDELKANARKEAELIISEAQLRGEKIVRDAETRRLQLVGEIQETKRQKVAFETGLRNLVESHLRLLSLDVVQMRPEDKRLIEQPPVRKPDPGVKG